jgi:hypothetical protein
MSHGSISSVQNYKLTSDTQSLEVKALVPQEGPGMIFSLYC